MNEPVPAPLFVTLFAMVGLGFVLQQTPLCVTVEPPSYLTSQSILLAVFEIFLELSVFTVASLFTFLRSQTNSSLIHPKKVTIIKIMIPLYFFNPMLFFDFELLKDLQTTVVLMVCLF